MVHIKRNAEGEVIALSRETPPAGDGWIEAADDAPDVQAFCAGMVDEADSLRRSDLGFVRVLEDVIDLLIDRAIIRFTDLPPAAQAKLMERRNVRAEMHRLSLLDGHDDVI